MAARRYRERRDCALLLGLLSGSQPRSGLRRCSLRGENYDPAIVCAFVAIIFLTGCNQECGQSIAPPPVALNSDAMGVFCGMNLLEHPGPKVRSIHREPD